LVNFRNWRQRNYLSCSNTWWISPSIDTELQRNEKRHPTIGNDVVIGSGAQIIGLL